MLGSKFSCSSKRKSSLGDLSLVLVLGNKISLTRFPRVRSSNRKHQFVVVWGAKLVQFWDLRPKFRGWADILITHTFITDYDVDLS